MSKTRVKVAPYDKDGNLLRFGERYHWRGPVEWRENVPFAARLTIQAASIGGSDSHVWLKDEQGRQFPMWTDDLIRAMLDAGYPGCDVIAHGVLGGRWMVAKKGFVYGLRLAKVSE